MASPADPTDSGPWGLLFLRHVFYCCDDSIFLFIDGFNLYHAIKRLNEPHLKWVDLVRLMHRQTSPKTETVQAVYYFSAYAHWLPDQRSRHEQYVAALNTSGAQVVLGQFKDKHKHCHECGTTWIQHEEKETDVNVALYVLNEAYRDTYDRAYIVSRDSDLKPAVEMVKMQFPKKEIFIIAPPHLGHSNDLIQVADGKQKIKKQQIEQSLFPATVQDHKGKVVATRPAEYDPPKIPVIA